MTARLRAEVKKLRGLAEALADEFDRVDDATKPQTGMRVSICGDFVAAAQIPSLVRRMRWWSRELRAALAEGEKERP